MQANTIHCLKQKPYASLIERLFSSLTKYNIYLIRFFLCLLSICPLFLIHSHILLFSTHHLPFLTFYFLCFFFISHLFPSLSIIPAVICHFTSWPSSRLCSKSDLLVIFISCLVSSLSPSLHPATSLLHILYLCFLPLTFDFFT